MPTASSSADRASTRATGGSGDASAAGRPAPAISRARIAIRNRPARAALRLLSKHPNQIPTMIPQGADSTPKTGKKSLRARNTTRSAPARARAGPRRCRSQGWPFLELRFVFRGPSPPFQLFQSPISLSRAAPSVCTDPRTSRSRSRRLQHGQPASLTLAGFLRLIEHPCVVGARASMTACELRGAARKDTTEKKLPSTTIPMMRVPGSAACSGVTPFESWVSGSSLDDVQPRIRARDASAAERTTSTMSPKAATLAMNSPISASVLASSTMKLEGFATAPCRPRGAATRPPHRRAQRRICSLISSSSRARWSPLVMSSTATTSTSFKAAH